MNTDQESFPSNVPMRYQNGVSTPAPTTEPTPENVAPPAVLWLGELAKIVASGMQRASKYGGQERPFELRRSVELVLTEPEYERLRHLVSSPNDGSEPPLAALAESWERMASDIEDEASTKEDRNDLHETRTREY